MNTNQSWAKTKRNRWRKELECPDNGENCAVLAWSKKAKKEHTSRYPPSRQRNSFPFDSAQMGKQCTQFQH